MSGGYAQALTMHNGRTVWNAVNDKMISGNGNRSGFLAQAPCDACNPCDAACGSSSLARNAWVNYIGRSDQYASNWAGHNRNNWKLSSEGVQAGTDLYRTKNTQFGILFGYDDARMRNTGDRVQMDDVYGGFYAARVFRNGADARIIFAYGNQDYDLTRYHRGVRNTASFDGYTTETNFELGKRFVNGAWSVRPVIALDVYNNNLKGATESSGIVYDKTSLTQASVRFGTDLRYHVRNFAFNSGLYYSYDMHDQVLRANVTGMTGGGPITLPLYGSKIGRELLSFNLGADYQISRNFSVFGGYQGEYVPDRDNSQVQSVGYVGAGWKW